MAIPINTNVDFYEKAVKADELIAKFLPVINPWASIFGVETTTTVEIYYPIAKQMKVEASKITDKDIKAPFADMELQELEKVEWKITNEFIKKGYSDDDTVEFNHLDPTGTVLMALQRNVLDKMAEQSLKHYKAKMIEYIKVIETADASALEVLKAILKAYDELFQLRKIDSTFKLYMKNLQYDDLVYLNDNKGVVGDNTITQALRFDGSKLYVKGLEVVVLTDDCFPDGHDIELVGRKGFKFYAMRTLTLTVRKQDLLPTKEAPDYYTCKGRWFAELIPYLTKDEQTNKDKSRYMRAIKVKAGESPSQKK